MFLYKANLKSKQDSITVFRDISMHDVNSFFKTLIGLGGGGGTHL